MAYPVVKALHIISFVSWFAALLYGVRLFIYHAQALAGPAAERDVLHRQFMLMERRLWLGIGAPAMILTIGFGLWLANLIGAWSQPWFHWKMLCIAALVGYHHLCTRIRKKLAVGQFTGSVAGLRVLNEGGTVFLVAVAFLATTKEPHMALVGVGGFLVLAGIIVSVMRLKRARS